VGSEIAATGPWWEGPTGPLSLEPSTLGAPSCNAPLPTPQTNGDPLSNPPQSFLFSPIWPEKTK